MNILLNNDFYRLGFGAVGGGSGGGGFGSTGFGKTTATPAVEDSGAREKFGNAKAISSDMYFGRNAHAPADADTSMKLNQFSGASSISSEQFYGRDEGSSRGPVSPSVNLGNINLQGRSIVATKLG
jgi:ADP-ribosylation factor GTPase-activating protein 2/3